MSRPVAVAKAALMEVGRGDLAEATRPNRAGWPSSQHSDADTPLIVRAYWLGHLTEHPDAVIGTDNDGQTFIDCPTCEESWA